MLPTDKELYNRQIAVDDVKPQLTRVKVRSVNDPDVKPEYVENLKKTKQGRLFLSELFPNDFRVDPNDLIPDSKSPVKTGVRRPVRR